MPAIFNIQTLGYLPNQFQKCSISQETSATARKIFFFFFAPTTRAAIRGVAFYFSALAAGKMLNKVLDASNIDTSSELQFLGHFFLYCGKFRMDRGDVPILHSDPEMPQILANISGCAGMALGASEVVIPKIYEIIGLALNRCCKPNSEEYLEMRPLNGEDDRDERLSSSQKTLLIFLQLFGEEIQKITYSGTSFCAAIIAGEVAIDSMMDNTDFFTTLYNSSQHLMAIAKVSLIAGVANKAIERTLIRTLEGSLWLGRQYIHLDISLEELVGS